MPFYAVAKGKQTGVYLTWSECQEQIVGFKGPVFKKFSTEEEAKKFIQERGSNVVDKRSEAKDAPQSNNEASSKSEEEPSKVLMHSGRISPTLLMMKKEMKDLQKQLSLLRTKFEAYINSQPRSLDSLKRGTDDDDEEEPSKVKKMKLTEEERNGSKFSVDSDGFLVVYTDGACGFNGKHGAKAGVGVYFGEDHPMNVSEPVKGRATNNTAEIQAATYALELAKSAGFDKVIINTDSQFMINCASSWMPNWKKNDWKKKDGSEVINREDLIELDKASDGLLVKWNHVNGHEGIPGNEAADKLAREGAKRYKKEE